MAGLVPLRRLAAMLEGPVGAAFRALRGVYPDPNEVPERARLCLEAVSAFREHFGDAPEVFVARSTGRINLMGMHVDHRGGFVNPIAIKDTFLIVQPREDDVVSICSADADAFPAQEFRISQELPAGKIQDWDAWTQGQLDERRSTGTAGDWSNYVKSAVLYLQHINTRDDGRFDPPLRGMNMAVKGSVPMAAGLSSSSSVVVGAAEACANVNGLALEPLEMVEACRLGEWYVGTRGGGGDHAAIKCGKRNHVSHIGSFPFSVSAVPFPEGYSLVLANSLVESKKQEGARDIFNERVASYEFSLLMLRRNWPEYAPKMEHLRDVNPGTLGVSQADIYRMIGSLPRRCTRAQVLEALPDDRERIERIFATHAQPASGYGIRQVCTYGIAECLRSDMAGKLLDNGDVVRFGELINISHDGDRVTRLVDGRRVPNDNDLTDASMDKLIADAESGDPARAERSQLWRQPGGYDVSTEEQDILVDVARATEGVLGAGLVGAGLGGSVVTLVSEAQANAVIAAMAQGYYEPRGLPVAAEVVRPVEGAGILELS